MQRTTCPVCLEWEILDHNGIRDKSWKCSHCEGTIENCPEVIIQFGLQYIASDELIGNNPGQQCYAYIITVAKAKFFPFEVAENFRIKMLQANKIVDLYTIESARLLENERNFSKYKANWFYAFDGEIGRLTKEDGKPLGSEWTYLIQGAGCSKTVYAAEIMRRTFEDPEQAAAHWYAQNKPRKVRQ